MSEPGLQDFSLKIARSTTLIGLDVGGSKTAVVEGTCDAMILQRREFPTRVTQRMQVIVQNNVITGALSSKGTIKPPLPAKLLQWFPVLRRIPARLVGMGVRPEHVRTLEAAAASKA